MCSLSRGIISHLSSTTGAPGAVPWPKMCWPTEVEVEGVLPGDVLSARGQRQALSRTRASCSAAQGQQVQPLQNCSLLRLPVSASSTGPACDLRSFFPMTRTECPQQAQPDSSFHFLPDMGACVSLTPVWVKLSEKVESSQAQQLYKISLVSWILISQALSWGLAPGPHCCCKLMTFWE